MAIKSTWIRRLLVDQNAPWVHLAAYILGPLNYITNFGLCWYNTLPLKVKNPFWLDVLTAWKNITETKFEKHTLDILYSPLWFNNKIGQPALYYPKWYKKGILFVGDLDTKGNFCTFNELKKKFKLDSVNILEYYKIKKFVQIFINKCGCSNLAKPIGPGRSAHLNILLKSKGGASDMYKVLNKTDFQPKMKLKWSIELGQDIEESKWRQILKSVSNLKVMPHLHGFNIEFFLGL